MNIVGGTYVGGTIADLSQLFAFSTFTFTAAGITGRNGPTLAQFQSAYTGEVWLSSYFNVITQGYQRWTVPISGNYLIRTSGSRAGKPTSGSYSYTPGNGAIVEGVVSLTQGDVLEIICGQYLDTSNVSQLSGYYGLGGGGGSFVKNATTGTLLFAAGGGGGASFYSSGGTPTGYSGENGRTTTSGGPGAVSASGAGGTNGSGGGIYTSQTHIYKGGAGGGWLGYGKNGDNVAAPTAPGTTYGGGGYSYAGGFIGGTYGTTWGNPSTYAATYGGFGGAGGSNGIINGGAGGGYSGGGISGPTTNAYVSQAGGGGSYIISSATQISTSDGNYEGSSTFNGFAITNLSSYNNGAGTVIVTKL